METAWIEKLREKQKRQRAAEEEKKKSEALVLFTKAIKMPIHSRTSALAWWIFYIPRVDEKAFEHYRESTTSLVLDNRFGGLFELREEPPAENAQELAAFILMNWYSYNKYDLHLEKAVKIVGRETVQKWLKQEMTK